MALALVASVAFVTAVLSSTPVAPGREPETAADTPDPAGAHDAGSQPAAPADGPGQARTPEEEQEEARLRAIRLQIDELRQRLVAGEEEAGSLLESLDEMDLTMAVLAREATLLERETAVAARAEARARTAAEETRRRAAAAEDDLRAWLVRLYKTGPAPAARLMLAASSPGGVALAARAAERLAMAQGQRVERLRAERAASDAAARAHEATLARLSELGTELESRRASLATARKGKGALLRDLRSRQDRGQQALSALVQVENDIQALIRSLPGAPGGAPGRGLPRFRGLLNWPVAGPVALGFGNVRHPRFDTQVPHPGLEIACRPGETVRALFDGRVVFSSWFRGYGQMIVIDHGDEYLSIYGQLGERLVEVGQEVGRDQPIAHSGEEGTFGVTGLYLEVRHQGRAEDPRPWLRKGGARAAGGSGRDDR